MLLLGPSEDLLSGSTLMVTGKNIPPQPKVPSTNVAFGRGVTITHKKSSSSAINQQLFTSHSHKSSSSSPSTKASIIRRSGSVGQLADTKSRHPTGASTSASVLNTNTNGKMCQCRAGACKCVPNMAFLEGIYVQNLQTQIEVLELENAYLRGATDRGPHVARKNTAISEQNPLAQSHPSPLARNWHSRGGNHVEGREEDEEEENEFVMEKSERERSSGRREKRVGFSTEGRVVRGGRGGVEELDEYFVDRGHGLLSGAHGNGSSWTKTTRRSDEEIGHLLAEEEEEGKELAIRRLKGEKEDLERKLRQIEGRATGEKRSLLAENVELQRRLEGLTPLLAEKETKLVKLEQQLEELNGTLRSQTKQMNAMQAGLEERARQSHVHATEREKAEQRLRLNLETANRELEKQKAREANLERELDELKAKMEQKETNWRREGDERQRALEEMSEELAQFGQKLDRTEREKSQMEAQLGEARQRNELLELELDMAREKVAQEQETMRELNAKHREWSLQEAEHRSALNRTQRELEALQTLSQSLANENKGLREERAELEDRIGELGERIHFRESRIRRVAELLNEFLEKYRLSSGRMRQQLDRQAEECEAFEQIVHKVRQMASSPVSPPVGSVLRPSTTTSSSNSPSQISSKTTKRSAGRSSRTKSD